MNVILIITSVIIILSIISNGMRSSALNPTKSRQWNSYFRKPSSEPQPPCEAPRTLINVGPGGEHACCHGGRWRGKATLISGNKSPFDSSRNYCSQSRRIGILMLLPKLFYTWFWLICLFIHLLILPLYLACLWQSFGNSDGNQCSNWSLTSRLKKIPSTSNYCRSLDPILFCLSVDPLQLHLASIFPKILA